MKSYTIVNAGPVTEANLPALLRAARDGLAGLLPQMLAARRAQGASTSNDDGGVGGGLGAELALDPSGRHEAALRDALCEHVAPAAAHELARDILDVRRRPCQVWLDVRIFA